MTISGILNSGLSALLANQSALRTTSSNIANVNTPDYVRRIVNFETQSSGDFLGGVTASAANAAVDKFMSGQRLTSTAAAGESDAVDKFLDELQASLGGLADSRDPASRLSAMTAGLAELAADPASAPRRAELLTKMQNFAQSIGDLANQIQELRAKADSEIDDAVRKINDLTGQITDLNGPIQRATLAGDETSALRDQRDNAIRQLAELVEIRVDEAASGRVNITTPSGYALVNSSAAQASHVKLTGASSETYFEPLTIQNRSPSTGDPVGNGEAFERHIAGGSLRGLLDLRDVTLPNIAAQVGALAASAAETFNAASNASTSYPAPGSLTGKNTGLLSTDALNFTGRSSVAVVGSTGILARRVEIDFDAGTLSVDGGAATAFTPTIGGLTTALNTALGGQGTASFTNGVLSLAGSGGNGIAVQQDATNPSSRAGRGFAHTFGLNDIFTSSAPTSFATGLTAGDAHGFTAGQEIGFAVRAADGSIARSFTYTVSGTSVGDVVTGLNAASGAAGIFSLDARGAISFTPSGGAKQKLEITGDETERGATGISLTKMFGIGQRYQMEQAQSFSVRPGLNAMSLPLAQLDMTSTSVPGDIVLASADNKGVLALQAAGGSAMFAAAGGLAASTGSLGQYAATMVASIGQKSAAATAASDDATAYRDDLELRAKQQQGVSLDEELANMIVFQQAYNAGARLITTAQRLYDELLQMVR
jgi:flagellar hook-associated protein 1 FlgK